jgi:hypothetical protein
VKCDNKKVKEVVTRHKGGILLMKLVGFSEEANTEGGQVWSN